jgi:DNA invertase Pin-like site-specific DNA recombinase
MTVALYARVSTADQDCAMQLRELRNYCARRNWTIAQEYVDTGFSGAKTSRPELDRMLSAARQRHFDAIVTWKLDRLGRSLAHLVATVQELSTLGIRFLAVTQGIDTDASNPMAKLMFNLLACFAEFERELSCERSKAGQDRARAAGKHVGRPKKVFRRDRVHELRAQGASYNQIAAKLKVSKGTVINVVREAVR